MKATRRQFLQTSTLATLAATRPLNATTTTAPSPEGQSLDAFDLAHRHLMVKDLPTPNFFEGMLLGNGDVGVCVVVRPDALGLHIGKNDCWDIRMSDEEMEENTIDGEAIPTDTKSIPGRPVTVAGRATPQSNTRRPVGKRGSAAKRRRRKRCARPTGGEIVGVEWRRHRRRRRWPHRYFS